MNKKLSITVKILKMLLLVGAVYIAASSPFFVFNLSKELRKRRFWHGRVDKDKFQNSFYYLKKRGYINIISKNKQIYIYLTKEGKKMAGKYQINDLKIKKPKKWDERWRLIIFDIPNKQKVKREAFRGKLKELGFRPLQKSVWVYPYECQKEIKLLRDFFGLIPKYLRVITTKELEEDYFLRKRFKLL